MGFDNKVVLNTFPSNRADALAFLFMQNQDLQNKTPEEITEQYFIVLAKINKTISTAKKNDDGHWIIPQAEQ